MTARFIVMHKTNARWEADERPTPELIQRVGAMVGELAAQNALLAGEGLRPSALGVRVKFGTSGRTVTPGPFRGENELPSGFVLLRVASLDEAVEWATRRAKITGDQEVDIRPLTEEWDLGVAPAPVGATTRRFMALTKATKDSEAGVPLSPKQRAELGRLEAEMKSAGVLLASESLSPSKHAKRLKAVGSKLALIDGPFLESKELVGGYVLLALPSLEVALDHARRYMEAVGCHELDVRPVL